MRHQLSGLHFLRTSSSAAFHWARVLWPNLQIWTFRGNVWARESHLLNWTYSTFWDNLHILLAFREIVSGSDYIFWNPTFDKNAVATVVVTPPLPPRIVVILALAKCRLAIKLSLQIVYFQAWGRTMLQISGQWCLFLIKYVEKQLARFANFYVFKARS